MGQRECHYGLHTASHGLMKEAQDLADRIVHTLAEDLRKTNEWHECYSGESGKGLAAAGFLSWDTLVAELQSNLAIGKDPLRL